MKHQALAIFFCLYLQNRATCAQHFSYGLHVGLNFSQEMIATKFPLIPQPQTTRTGFLAGGYTNFGLVKKFSVQPEFLYSSMGTTFPPNFYSPVSSRVERMKYLSMPLLLRYDTKSNFYFLLGPQVSYLINVKDIQGDASTDVTNRFYKFDFGVTSGVGYVLGRFNILIRYYEGFTNTWSLSDLQTVKNASTQILAAYRIKINKK